jgi:tetratricopeptide (TPR) repeat protein
LAAPQAIEKNNWPFFNTIGKQEKRFFQPDRHTQGMRMTLALVLISTLGAQTAGAQTADRTQLIRANAQALQAQRAGEYDVAESRWRLALRLVAQLRPEQRDPADEAVLHGNMAALYVEQQEFSHAWVECERALAFHRTADLLNGAGIILQGLDRLTEAEAAYEEALRQLRPGSLESARTRFNLATLWARQGRQAEALSAMEANLPLLEADPVTQATALWHASRLSTPERARAWLTRAQELMDRTEPGHNSLRRMILEARAERETGRGVARELRKQANRLRTPAKAGVSVEQLRREGY